MIEAGIYELRYGAARDDDEEFFVRSIYVAMELERLEARGELPRLR